ncbi:hypothetical protein BX616_010867 [Lobosporangium transversale]|nr:hypothetical protein BX616_010867 [Lobosporangium transversale]
MSEGTTALLNVATDKRSQGAIGFRGPIQRILAPTMKVVKVDTDTNELIRDEKTGFCIECRLNEPGELITLADNKTHSTRYQGYFNQPKMTQAKLVHNAFVQGDVYFRTGDLVYRNEDQYWFFVDRTGDTYRWKGENVSTAEVADTLGRVEGVVSCVVYGVTIPGQDGRAGMATLVLKDSILQRPTENGSRAVVNEQALNNFLQRMSEYVAKNLPSYAVPRFLRICEQDLEITGTFKNKKEVLKKEGFDLNLVKDRLYWWTPQRRYERFDRTENEQIYVEQARL